MPPVWWINVTVTRKISRSKHQACGVDNVFYLHTLEVCMRFSRAGCCSVLAGLAVRGERVGAEEKKIQKRLPG